MKQFGRVVPFVLAGVWWGGACGGGDSTGTGPQAASVTGIAGDNQSGPTGSALGFPLSFIALDGSGHPVAGVHVTWSVTPSGAAFFSPATASTDVNGSTFTSVTLGPTIGSITLTAAVSGVPNVVFHATAVDPCTYVAPYTFGQTVNGTLTAADCHRNLGPGVTFYYDFHGLIIPSGQQNIRVSMHGSFDGWLDFWSGTGPYLAFDDDSILGVAQNPQLDIILPAGSYVMGASSFNVATTGTYSISATTRSTAMNGCRQVWVIAGVAVTDSVTLADCADSSASTHYYDVARIIVFDTTVLNISQQSTAFPPALELYKVLPESNYVRHLVASNDTGSTATNAFINYEVDSTNVYDIIIGTTAGGQTGVYTFSVDTSAVLLSGAVPTSPGGGRRERAGRGREWWRQRPGEMLLDPRTVRARKL